MLGPTFILVGGKMSLDDGSTMDSRQMLEDDPISRVALNALTGSALWWRTVESLVLPILAERGEESFCFAIGRQMVNELQSDGSLARRRLPSLLHGGSATIDMNHVSDDSPLPAGWVQVGHRCFQPGPADKKWHIANIDYKPSIVRATGAAVVVDARTTPWYATRFDETMEELDEGLGSAGVPVIFPHVASIESTLKQYVAWIKEGRPEHKKKIPRFQLSTEEFQRLRDTVPVPVSASFGVTGLLRAGEWVESGNLEAARHLLETRFDLKLGLWDLADNPVLRTTLLGSVPIDAPESKTAEIPAGARRHANKAGAARQDEAQRRSRSKQEIFSLLTPLGWRVESSLIYPVVDWHGRLDDGVLLHFTFSVRNHLTAISIAGRLPEGGFLRYLKQRAPTFMKVAAPAVSDISENRAVIWRADGGWADPVDWDHRVQDIAERVPHWIALTSELAQAITDAQRNDEAARIETYKSWGLPEKDWR